MICIVLIICLLNFHTEIRKIVVKDNDQLVPNLNELEYIKGDIWANVYQVHSS